jgi:outer membrane biosynthesis protein TonB
MDRARRAVVIALFLVLSLGSVVLGVGIVPSTAVRPAAVVTWPPATLLLAELMTGGASASDEFVELTNAGPEAVDLVGLEIVYVSASGSTIARKATWPLSLSLEPGRHLLLANGAGIHAAAADATYTGGLAGTGGALVIRPIGGAPIDAVGWGDATSGFVEGPVAPVPPAGSSLERRPGGVAGNGLDSNDNAADWFVQAVPSPQNLASAPTPEPTPSPQPTPSTSVTPTPTSSAAATPTPSATADSTPSPTATSSPTPTPSPSPPPPPTPSPVPSPSATPVPIAEARALPDGASVTVGGTLTTALGALEAGRTAFVQDTSGGIALYLDAPAVDAWPAGTNVVATGALDDRFAQRTLRVALTGLTATGTAAVPMAVGASTGFAGEDVEGQRIVVAGTTVGSPSAMADGTGLLVDDGTGPLRVVVAPAALGVLAVPAGTAVTAVGPLGQRDSTGTGIAGYRLHATEPGDLVLVTATATPAPTASPSGAPTPTAEPTATSSATPAPAATPTPGATPSPSPSPGAFATILAARAMPVGSVVSVSGVVTADAGRLGAPALVAIDDDSAGIVVKLPAGVTAPARGAWIEVRGTLAAPYGQIELRVAAGGLSIHSTRALPAPLAIDGVEMGEGVEARQVTVVVEIDAKPKRSQSGDLTIAATAEDGTAIRVLADSSSGLTAAALVKAESYALTGIAGQRASRKGALDGYRLWLRDTNDIVRLGGGAAPTATPSTRPSPSGATHAAATIPIAQALLARSGEVMVEGTVTVDASLLDTTGRRIVLEDSTAAVEVLAPAGVVPPGVGSRVSVLGTMARAYGAPRIRATELREVGPGLPRQPLVLRAAPGPAHEWRLVRLSGTIVEVHKLGSRWRVELQAGGARVPVSGLSGAAIPVTLFVEGRRATVVGIVRRPHPSATDRRFAIVPRSPADVAVGPAESAGSQARGAPGPGVGPGRPGAGAAGPLDVDLARLADHVGETVRVGGLVVDLAADGVSIDDGSALGSVVLTGEAAEYLPLLEPGDAINAIGRVERRDDASVVVVRDPAGLSRVGDLAELPSEPPTPSNAVVRAAEAPRTASSDSFGLGIPGTAGVASLVLISVASAGVTLLRRRWLQQRLLAPVRARLAAIGRSDSGPDRGSSASP